MFKSVLFGWPCANFCKCFPMLFYPVCLSFSVFCQPGKTVFKCFNFHFAYRFQCFLLNQVRPCLNVLIFIFWSLTLLRERSGLVFSFGGFPLEKFADIPRCLMLFPHYLTIQGYCVTRQAHAYPKINTFGCLNHVCHSWAVKC